MFIILFEKFNEKKKKNEAITVHMKYFFFIKCTQTEPVNNRYLSPVSRSKQISGQSRAKKVPTPLFLKMDQ